jgi:hypothetical protein
MKPLSINKFQSIFLFCALLFTLGPTSVYGAWFDNNWHYRVPIIIPAGTDADSTIKVDVNFASLLSSIGVSGTFDVNSPRIVRIDDSTLSTYQEFTDTVYLDVTDATGNSQGEIRFILEDGGATTYYLYFDITANGSKAANPKTPINGNFEKGSTGTQSPIGWTGAKAHANFDAQVRPSEKPEIETNGSNPSPSPNKIITDGTPYTGSFSYMLGARTNNEIGSAYPALALRRNIQVPSKIPGNLVLRYRLEGWDSSDDFAAKYDFLRIQLYGDTTTEIIGPNYGNYVTYPFSPNKGLSGISNSGSGNSGFGAYNYWDMDRNENHKAGMKLKAESEPWFTRTYSLSAYAGQTIILYITSSHEIEFKTWIHIDDVEWSVVKASLGAASSSVTSVTPTSFNCVEIGGTASSGRLYTKVAGSAFSFDVVALKSDGSVESSYVTDTSKNVSLELVDGSESTACASRSALSPAVSQTLTFASLNQGRKTSAGLTVSKAYSNLRCRITDANQSPSIVGCSTDNFAVRPSGFTVTSNMNADASGASISATPILKTGANFTLSAASGVVGYNSTPQLDTSKLAAHSGASQIGTLSGIFLPANVLTGLSAGTTFTYSEVGYFRLASYGVFDTTFTSVDSLVNDCSNDFSNVLVGGKYGCNFGNTAATSYFGRFIPDHLALTPGSSTPACSPSFTYFGQDGFNTLFTLKAQNSSNQTTQNYQGGFAKLGLTAWGNFNFSSTSLPAGSVLSASSTAPSGNWSLGLADVLAKHQVSRPTSLTAETSIIVKAAPVDSDGVTLTATAVAPGTPLRYGRLNLQNVYGSELLQLPVSLTAQYWNGSAFVLNTDDSCTTVSAPASGSGLTFYPEVTAGVQGNHLSAAETIASVSATNKLVAGDAQLKFTAPGIGNDGYFDLSITAPNWLKFDWNAAIAGDESPSARATFGIYKGNDSQIFLREVY